MNKLLHQVHQSLMRYAGVRSNVHFGNSFHIGQGSLIWAPQHLEIGNQVYVGKNVTIQVDGKIGDHVLLANTVGIVGRTDHAIHEVGKSVRESTWVGKNPTEMSLPITIGSDVWVGYGATILSGISIGDSSVVAAGSVVTKDIPANTVVAGIPARKVGQRFNDSEFIEHWRILKTQGIRTIVQ